MWQVKKLVMQYLKFLKIVLVLSLLFVVAVDFFRYVIRHEPQLAITFVGSVPQEGTVEQGLFYIAGAVQTPGIYPLDEGMRVSQAIELAGGFNEEADLGYVNETLNLAGRVEDEQHILVPFREKSTNLASSSSTVVEGKGGGKVRINSASLAQLITLPGIGESTAQKIIAARPFASESDILEVSGVGESKLAQFIELISFE